MSDKRKEYRDRRFNKREGFNKDPYDMFLSLQNKIMECNPDSKKFLKPSEGKAK